MNNEPTTGERQKLIAAAADSYTAPPPQSHTVLMPIRDSLATLRRKGASYRTIAHILREADIEVSLDTLSRFCRDHVEEPPPRKDKRRSAIRAASGHLDEMPPPAQPTPTEADSVTQIKPIADALGDRCRYVIVKNQAHSEHFALYEKSRTRGRLVDELKAGELVMPRMYDWLVAALNQHNLTATQAQAHSSFNVVDRQRLKNWQKTLYTQVDAHAEALLSDVQTTAPHE